MFQLISTECLLRACLFLFLVVEMLYLIATPLLARWSRASQRWVLAMLCPCVPRYLSAYLMDMNRDAEMAIFLPKKSQREIAYSKC